MSKALYRTYRSRSFDEIVGQTHVTGLLKNAIAEGKIAHAYLLTGPRGVGKTSVARIIAHAVNKLEYSENPQLDIIEIDAASNRRIDDIRDLREKVHIAPVSAPYKVYIIDEVHMLTGESFNALLKTLEEPPSHVIFILATTEIHKVPATIISRTQRFHFRPAAVEDVVAHLSTIAKKEKIPFEPEALKLIAVHAGGSFRDSVSLLDQLSGLSETITTKLVESVLGMAEQHSIDAILDALDSNDVNKLVTELENLQSSGISATVLTDQLSRALTERAKSNHNLYQLLDELTDVPKAHDPQLKLITTLVRFAKPTQHKTVASQAVRRPSLAAKPAVLREQVAKRNASDAVSASKTTDLAKEAKSVSPINEQKTFDWDHVLAMIKKHHAPLYSVLARAEVQYEETTQNLQLGFTYAIHRKKIENPTYRKQLRNLMHDLFGFVPEVTIIDATNKASLNEDALAVAVIMGGGEPVSGTV